MDKNEIQLVPAAENDTELDALMDHTEDVEKYMSEVRTYKEPKPDTMRFRVEVDGRLGGEAMLKSIRWITGKAELSIYLLKEYRNAGLGRMVTVRLLDFIFNELGFHRAEAEIYEYNEPSVRLAIQAGFVEEGRLREAKLYKGKYYDIIRFGLLKEEYLRRSMSSDDSFFPLS